MRAYGKTPSTSKETLPFERKPQGRNMAFTNVELGGNVFLITALP
jgi:hypothetical protein